MKVFLVLIFLTLFQYSFQDKWAVLVAGSNGYSNYRHQADVCHAYHTLIKKGVKAQNIIVFAYDDIAYSSFNPFQGQIFNKPDAGAGQDVYSGCVIDYKGNAVTPTNYINVITGNAAAMSGIGSERVLQSTSSDNVFIYFSDHGGYGLIAFPNEYLYVDDFQNALLTMYNNNMFYELVYYLEACESGSMFLNFPTDKKIYALTASNPYQSSYATYCSSTDTVNGVNLNTCLGDLFSVSFLEDTDAANTATKTLQQQFITVKALTTSSVVTQYGQQDFTYKNIGQWVGEKITFKIKIPLLYKYFLLLSIWDARTVKLQTLYRLWQNQLDDDCRKSQFYEEARKITKISLVFQNVTQRLGISMEDCDKQQIDIRDFECVKKLVDIFESNCMSFGEFGLKFIYYIVYLCENNRQYDSIEAKAQFLIDSCTQQDLSFEDYSIEYAEQLDNADVKQPLSQIQFEPASFDTTLSSNNDTSQNSTDQSGNNRLLTDQMNQLRRRF